MQEVISYSFGIVEGKGKKKSDKCQFFKLAFI
jgi:hypothetical protein